MRPADPIGSRLRLRRRGRPGHEKLLPLPWLYARFADAASTRADLSTRAAREVINCPGPDKLGRILEGVHGRLTAHRFLSNLGLAVSTYTFRVPPDPVAARRVLCRS
jgi:arabinofuranosyltransferase